MNSDAMRAFQAAIERNPNYYEAHLALGVAMRKAGNMTEARPHFEKAAGERRCGGARSRGEGASVMRVVIIGGSGHIGSYLTPRLVNGGHTVVNVSRRQAAAVPSSTARGRRSNTQS